MGENPKSEECDLELIHVAAAAVQHMLTPVETSMALQFAWKIHTAAVRRVAACMTGFTLTSLSLSG